MVGETAAGSRGNLRSGKGEWPYQVQLGRKREQRGSEGWSRLLQGDLIAESSKASFKINQFREDTTRCRLFSESTALATWTAACAGGSQRPQKLLKDQPHLQLVCREREGTQPPDSRTHQHCSCTYSSTWNYSFLEAGARQGWSWQVLRDGTGCAGVNWDAAVKWHSWEGAPVPLRKPLEHCTGSAPLISPGVQRLQRTGCWWLVFVSSGLWIQDTNQLVQWVCQDQTQSWLSSPFWAFTQLEGHLPPLPA